MITPDLYPSPYTAYSHRAKTFIAQTQEVDMSALHDEFLSLLPAHASILDVGAGSGRDSKEFLDRGHSVTILEPDRTLALEAAKYTAKYPQHPVVQETIQEYTSEVAFDGIWASASLLHIPLLQLADAMVNLARLLVTGGVLYMSFKYGDHKVVKSDGLYYSYLNEHVLDLYLPTAFFEYQRVWVTSDVRPDRTGERWLNCIVRRTAVETSSIDILQISRKEFAKYRALKAENEALQAHLASLQQQPSLVKERVQDILAQEWRKASPSTATALKHCVDRIDKEII